MASFCAQWCLLNGNHSMALHQLLLVSDEVRVAELKINSLAD